MTMANQTGYRGVKHYNRGPGFVAHISIGNRKKTLAVFPTAKEAARAYDRACVRLGRPAANFPEEAPATEARVLPPLTAADWDLARSCVARRRRWLGFCRHLDAVRVRLRDALDIVRGKLAQGDPTAPDDLTDDEWGALYEAVRHMANTEGDWAEPPRVLALERLLRLLGPDGGLAAGTLPVSPILEGDWGDDD